MTSPADPLDSHLDLLQSSFKTLADAIPMIVWTAESTELLEYLNLQGVEYFDSSMKHPAWSLLEELHPDDVERTRICWQQAMQTGAEYKIEFRLRRSLDGVYRWHSCKGLPLRDESGAIVRWLGTAVDIHEQKTAAQELEPRVSDRSDDSARINADMQIEIAERKKIEEALYESERCYAEIAANLPGAAVYQFALLPDGSYQFPFMSESIYAMSGLTAEQIQLDPLSLFALVTDDLDMLNASIAESAVTMRLWSVDFRWNLKSGELRWIRGRSQPRRLADGRILWNGIIADVTEKKQAEVRLMEFYSVVSHELRSPLTSIRASLGLMEGGLAGFLSPDAVELVQIARLNCDRLHRLVNDILDLSKIEQGTLTLKVQECNARELVEISTSSMAGMLGASGCTVQVDIGMPAPVMADRDRIVQVLTNFLSNAIKFSTENSVIRICVIEQPSTVRFEVYDTGIGIHEENFAKLFGRFQQVDSSDSRSKEGSGLGLAISKAIVDEHRGAIGFDSTLNEGSMFWFDLPKIRTKAQS